MKLRSRESREERELRPGQVLGRSPQCEHTLDDESVSRRHARVEERAGELWLVDLGSSNGTRCNGQRAQEVRLRPGDLITLGTLAFEVVGQPAAAPFVAAAEPAATTESAGSSAAVPAAREEAAPRRRPEATLADGERARIRAELRAAKRSRGFGDLGQQPVAVRVFAALLGLALLAGMFYGVRWLGHLIVPD